MSDTNYAEREKIAAQDAEALAQVDLELFNAEGLNDQQRDDERTSAWKGRVRALAESSDARSAKGVTEWLAEGTVREICVRLHGLRAELASRLYNKARLIRAAEADAYREALRSPLLKTIVVVVSGGVVLMLAFAVFGVFQLRGFSWDLKEDMRKVSDDHAKAVKSAEESIRARKEAFESEAKTLAEFSRDQRDKITTDLKEAEQRVARVQEDLQKLLEERADQYWRPRIERAVAAQEDKIPVKVGELVPRLEPASKAALDQRMNAALESTVKSEVRLDQMGKTQLELASQQVESKKQTTELEHQLEAARDELRAIQAALQMKNTASGINGLREFTWLVRYWWYGVGVLVFSAVVSVIVFLRLLADLSRRLRQPPRARPA